MRRRLTIIVAVCATLAAMPALALDLLPNAQQTFSGPNGSPLSGGFVYTYVPGTTTPKLTFQDPGGLVPNTNPIVLDANGQARIWGLGQFREIVYDQFNNLLWDKVTQTPGTLPQTILGNVSFGPNTSASLTVTSPYYFPAYTQLTAFSNVLNLAGAIADATGSFTSATFATITDSDTTVYTQSHSNYATFSTAYGPVAGGIWATTTKNIIGFYAAGFAATSAAPIPGGFAPGVSGVNAECFQYGAGICSNEFAAHNPTPGNGSIAQSISMAAVQAIIDSSYQDVNDAFSTSYAVLATGAGSKMITAYYGASGVENAEAFMNASGVPVSIAAIVMPHSADGPGVAGSKIDYGRWNGGVQAYTYWNQAVQNGTYYWVSNNTVLMNVSTAGIVVGTGNVLANAAVAPFLYLSTTNGTPTGVPTLNAASQTACEYNTASHTLNCYDGVAASWYHQTLTSGGG